MSDVKSPPNIENDTTSQRTLLNKAVNLTEKLSRKCKYERQVFIIYKYTFIYASISLYLSEKS